MQAPDPRTVVHRTIAPPPFHTELPPLARSAPAIPPAPRWALPVSIALLAFALALFAGAMAR